MSETAGDQGRVTTRSIDVTMLPPLGEVLERAREQLAAWMSGQRWFAHKGAGAVSVEVVGWADIATDPDLVVVDAVLRVHAGENPPVLYQVPLSLRLTDSAKEAPLEEGSEVGVVAVPGGPVRIDDATRDAQGRRALITMMLQGAPLLGEGARLAFELIGEHATPEISSTRLLSGEQSNTSLIAEFTDASPLIVKMFRVLADGENPDVMLQAVLTERGSDRVPAVMGSARIAAADIRTHAAIAQEFLADVQDAWRTALRDASEGRDFTRQAHALGAVLANVHNDLAAALPTTPTDEQVREAMIEQMLERLQQVSAEVPQVADHQSGLAQVIEHARDHAWPAMQRIHGDLHLGQVLAVPDRGWVMLDFEGEPLRSLEQRSRADSPLRDVAGMLRSLDYVAGSVALNSGDDVSAWSAAAREAFLAGYARLSPLDMTQMQPVIDAFEADKAVYEALYEARNRPNWLPIPLRALQRISPSQP